MGGRYTASRSHEPCPDPAVRRVRPPDEQTTSRTISPTRCRWAGGRTPTIISTRFVATGFRPGGLNTPDLSACSAGALRPGEGHGRSKRLEGQFRRRPSAHDGRRLLQRLSGISRSSSATRHSAAWHRAQRVRHDQDLWRGSGGGSSLRRSLADAGVNLLHSELGSSYAVDPRNMPPAAPPSPLCNPAQRPGDGLLHRPDGRVRPMRPNFTFNARRNMHSPRRQRHAHAAGQFRPCRHAMGDACSRIRARRPDRRAQHPQRAARLAARHWTVTAYGTNLTNQHYVGALNSGLDFAGAPRQYGIKLRKLF